MDEFLKIFIIIFFTSILITSCECTLSDVSCLQSSVDFTIEYRGINVFDQNSEVEPDSILIVQNESKQLISNFSRNNDSFSVNQISENKLYAIVLNGVCYNFELLYSNENFDCCNFGGIHEIRFDEELICAGLEVNDSSCAFNPIITLRIM